jgi:outer membrane protein TolC
MKKKLLGVVPALAMMMLLMMLCASTIFAEDAENADAGAEDAIVPNMNFTGEPISLSLADALERITSVGPGYESAVLAKESLEAQAKGQEELWYQFRSASNALSAANSMIGSLPPEAAAQVAMTINPMHTLNARLVKIARPYLEEQAAVGYEIDVNKLIYDTTEVYHSVLQAQEALAIAEENRRIQDEILANTQKKFELGMVSKMDVLSAESAVQDAVVKVNAASFGLTSAKMSFNIQLDLPVMQTVVLTDTLHKVDAPAIDLKTSIVKALASRNELKQLQFVLDKENLEIADLATASRYGSEYLTAALELKTAEKNLKDTKAYIELEIRAKYLSLKNLSDEIASIEKTVANAKEGYRLADLAYNAGMNTLVDVQNIQLASYQAQLGLAAKILEYNLAVSDLEIAVGYGRGNTR